VRTREAAAAVSLSGRVLGRSKTRERRAAPSAGSGARPAADAPSASTVALVSPEAPSLRALETAATAGGLEVTVSATHPGILAISAGRRGPDAVLVSCPGSPAQRFAWVRMLRGRFAESVIVAALGPDEHTGLRSLIGIGADACVVDNDLGRALSAAIDAARVGCASVPHDLQNRLGQPALSYREREVLAAAVNGAPAREIASVLCLAESTVKSHLASAYAKLGVHSRAEAAERLLDPTDGIDIGLRVRRAHVPGAEESA
jgi:DNA-binding NarL/FixJ family response regulator